MQEYKSYQVQRVFVGVGARDAALEWAESQQVHKQGAGAAWKPVSIVIESSRPDTARGTVNYELFVQPEECTR